MSFYKNIDTDTDLIVELKNGNFYVECIYRTDGTYFYTLYLP